MRAWARRERGLLAVLAFGGALRLLLLNVRSLWFDETATLYIAQSPLADVVGRVRALEENPPLHYLLMHFWIKPFADPVLGLRLFSALCGVASLGVFAALCERVMPKQRTLACALAALSSFWIHFAQDGRIYGLLLLLGLSATLVFVQLLDRWRLPRAAGYAALALAGLYTHDFFAFLLLGHACSVALAFRGQPRALAAWGALYAAILLAYAPWLSADLAQIRLLARASVLREPLTLRNLGAVVGTMLFDDSFLGFAHEGATRALGLAALAALAGGVWVSRDRLRPAGGAAFCLVQLLVPLAALRLAEVLVGRAATQARYLICVSPFLYMLLAWLLDKPLSGLARPARAAAAAVMAAGAAAYFAGGLYVDPHLPELARALRSAPASDVIVYLDPYWYLPMRYYYLPERTQRLAGPDAKIANWEGLPGYPSYISRDELAGLERCVVIDPRHKLSRRTIALASGAQAAAAAYP